MSRRIEQYRAASRFPNIVIMDSAVLYKKLKHISFAPYNCLMRIAIRASTSRLFKSKHQHFLQNAF
eukprot:5941815-Pyramimonas_sp.AAC.2